MEKIDYEARVDAGIALIDEKFPGFLDEHLNLDILDIKGSNRCVTAQLAQWYGDNNDLCYTDGMDLLGLDDGEHSDGSHTKHGFNTESWSAFVDAYGISRWPAYNQEAAYNTLQEIWERKISERRAARV